MNDKANTTIVLLVISAVLLSAMLFAARQTSQTARAGNTAMRFGDYIMCPGARESDADNLYVIDVRKQRMNVYMIEPGRADLANHYRNVGHSRRLDQLDKGRYVPMLRV